MRVVPFEPRLPARQEGDTRYPRFSEVATHIDSVAFELFDGTGTLAAGQQLYAQLREMISAEALELLDRFYETMIAYEEQFEHAAYVVGLQAGTGHLALARRLISERHGEARPRETPAWRAPRELIT